MPWWGWLIAGSVAAFCATVLTTARMVVRALCRYGEEDQRRHAELLRWFDQLPAAGNDEPPRSA